MNVVTFGNHLSAYEKIEFALIQCAQRAFEILMAAYRVTIQAGDADLRKHAVQEFFELFRSGAQKINVLAAAMDAGFRDRCRVSAVVADHLVLALVVSERNGAIAAFQLLAAGTAKHDGGVSATVEQHHHLLPALETGCNLLREFAGDYLFMAGFLELHPHVDDFHFGQRALLDAIGNLDQRVFVLFGVEVGLKRWCGGAKNHDRIRHLGAHHGYVTGVIARSFFLFVGRVVLFINDQQSQIVHGGENGGTRADHDTRIAALDAMPLLGALAVA